MVTEINRNFGPEDSFTVEYDANKMWDGTSYFGVSPLAWKRLLDKHGYQFVYMDSNGINAFFIRRSTLLEWLKSRGITKVTDADLKEILPSFLEVYHRQSPIHAPHDYHRFRSETLKNRKWVEIKE